MSTNRFLNKSKKNMTPNIPSVQMITKNGRISYQINLQDIQDNKDSKNYSQKNKKDKRDYSKGNGSSEENYNPQPTQVTESKLETEVQQNQPEITESQDSLTESDRRLESTVQTTTEPAKDYKPHKARKRGDPNENRDSSEPKKSAIETRREYQRRYYQDHKEKAKEYQR